MNQELVSISVDSVLILRITLAILWGGGFAAFLQFHHWGKWLVEERTWMTVVAGIGVDMIIAFHNHIVWWTIMTVIAGSFIGILVRSLYNEKYGEINTNKYTVKQQIENAIAYSRAAIEMLEKLLDNGERLAEVHVTVVSRTLGKLHRVNDTLITIRRGEPTKRAAKGGKQ